MVEQEMVRHGMVVNSVLECGMVGHGEIGHKMVRPRVVGHEWWGIG